MSYRYPGEDYQPPNQSEEPVKAIEVSERCTKCYTLVKEPSAETGFCWWCKKFLCSLCWSGDGHCGHPEAKMINEQSILWTDEIRRRMLKAIEGE